MKMMGEHEADGIDEADGAEGDGIDDADEKLKTMTLMKIDGM
jgi:hypothetical protein